MKLGLIFLIMAGFSKAACCQDALPIEAGLNQAAREVSKAIHENQINKEMLDLVDSIFKWHIQENDKAYMLTQDIPYPDFRSPEDYLSITIVKFKGIERPRVISFALSSTIDSSKGLSLYFARTNPDQSITMSGDIFERVPFSEINSDFVKLSADYAYLDKDMKLDILKPMLENNHAIFEFTNANGQVQRIGYPLGYFQKEIEKLK